MKRRARRIVRRLGTLAAVVLVTAVGFAAPAAAVSKYGHCSNNDRHYEWAVNYQLAGSRYQIQSYSYKIYGPIRDQNNIEIYLVRESTGDMVPGSRYYRDNIPETSSTAWTNIPIPDYYVGTNDRYNARGWAKFDVSGLDPSCKGNSTPF